MKNIQFANGNLISDYSISQVWNFFSLSSSVVRKCYKFGTPTKRQVSKRQVSKRPVSKRLKRQVYKTSGLQNVRFTKCQVYKTSGLQNVRLQKTSMYILYSWLVVIRRFCCSHVCWQSEGCVLFSILEGFLPYNTFISNNDTLFTLNRNANLAIPILFV
jgi:hypothetical protein